jgi:hypothetical protein
MSPPLFDGCMSCQLIGSMYYRTSQFFKDDHTLIEIRHLKKKMGGRLLNLIKCSNLVLNVHQAKVYLLDTPMASNQSSHWIVSEPEELQFVRRFYRLVNIIICYLISDHIRGCFPDGWVKSFPKPGEMGNVLYSEAVLRKMLLEPKLNGAFILKIKKNDILKFQTNLEKICPCR